MTSYTYLLSSGPASRESGRLDFQHVFWGKLTGSLLPKSISEHLSTIPSPRIADIGTGTANWLVDLGAQLPPTSSLYGFDINAETFPPADKLAPNITLEALNVVEPFPENHVGSYDLVHARLLMYALKKDEWEVLAKNLASLLKPGGWVLWEETGYASWVSLPPSKAINAILELDIAFAKKAGRDITHPAKLHTHVENAGFVDCSEKHHTNFDLFATDEGKRVYIYGLGQAVRGIVARGGMPGLTTQEDAERLVNGMEEDLFSDNTLYGMQMKWVWGRKPE